jgi:hypothetical protein
MRFPFAHYPTTLRDQTQSFGQLHGWTGGVVPSRLPFSFPFRQGAPIFSGLAAGQSLGCLSSLHFGCSAREKVVRSRDVGMWRIAPVQLCVSLQKIFSQQWQNSSTCFKQDVVEYLPILEDFT